MTYCNTISFFRSLGENLARCYNSFRVDWGEGREGGIVDEVVAAEEGVLVRKREIGRGSKPLIRLFRGRSKIAYRTGVVCMRFASFRVPSRGCCSISTLLLSLSHSFPVCGLCFRKMLPWQSVYRLLKYRYTTWCGPIMSNSLRRWIFHFSTRGKKSFFPFLFILFRRNVTSRGKDRGRQFY